ncbi:MAG TPA: class I SAM-dependent methyltransferase [Bryobacteraceae bacterium]|jgi:predicted O-methyltransferase YrrM|nr:class I SAM-dependent methyltransferase [Bryobacteraceae bacterium]
MSRTSEYLPEKIYEYLTSVSVREPPILRKLREETASHPMGGMQIPPEHGQFLALLMQLIGARRTLEVGVFTGYSSLAVALALPDDGKILACDVSEEYTSVARRYWKEAGVDHMIELRLKPALETLHELIAQRQHNRYDFAFIDADKANYEGYYECALELVRPGGLIAIDNVLWHGRVIDPEANDADTLAIRAINKKLLGDSRVAISMLPVSDGLTLACKR